MNRLCATRPITSFLLIVVLSAVFLQAAWAQTSPNYRVTVNSATSNNVLYSTVGHNSTLVFQAVWSFGENSGQAIENANVTVEVKTAKDEVIDMVVPTTNSTGFLSFNYSTQTPEILTFTPTNLISQDGIEWNSTLVQGETNLYGLQAESITAYYDTFDVTLVSANTNTQGTTSIIVNVTYLLVPEEGLTLPPESSYLNQTYFPKIAQNVNVTINGVEAQKSTDPGTYSAEFPTSLPTAYVLVKVSQGELVAEPRSVQFHALSQR